ncbi:unnamed protein product [Brachionus calyciflorus]|uniref:Uncharacterized protein n=1 Tax=Brachionus calyciflorus TaxID=104777 RepID=A0A814AX95_9BILA|nr:unnamed protein product [Brachionus calyciflorus]
MSADEFLNQEISEQTAESLSDDYILEMVKSSNSMSTLDGKDEAETDNFETEEISKEYNETVSEQIIDLKNLLADLNLTNLKQSNLDFFLK